MAKLKIAYSECYKEFPTAATFKKAIQKNIQLWKTLYGTPCCIPTYSGKKYIWSKTPLDSIDTSQTLTGNSIDLKATYIPKKQYYVGIDIDAKPSTQGATKVLQIIQNIVLDLTSQKTYYIEHSGSGGYHIFIKVIPGKTRLNPNSIPASILYFKALGSIVELFPANYNLNTYPTIAWKQSGKELGCITILQGTHPAIDPLILTQEEWIALVQSLKTVNAFYRIYLPRPTLPGGLRDSIINAYYTGEFWPPVSCQDFDKIYKANQWRQSFLEYDSYKTAELQKHSLKTIIQQYNLPTPTYLGKNSNIAILNTKKDDYYVFYQAETQDIVIWEISDKFIAGERIESISFFLEHYRPKRFIFKKSKRRKEV